MKSRLQRVQRTRIVFQTQKTTAKVQHFHENSLAFQLRAVGKYGASWKVEWGFYVTFNGNAEGGYKKEGKEQKIFILNQGRIENPAKRRRLFSQKRFFVDTWQGSEYASNSENNETAPRSYYSLSTLLFNLITSLVARNSEFHSQSKIFDRVLIMPQALGMSRFWIY